MKDKTEVDVLAILDDLGRDLDETNTLKLQAVDLVMGQAQVFASTWALVNGPFDHGQMLEQAERERANLRSMLGMLVGVTT